MNSSYVPRYRYLFLPLRKRSLLPMLEAIRYLTKMGQVPTVVTRDPITTELLRLSGYQHELYPALPDDYDVLFSEGVGGLESERVWLQESKSKGKINYAIHNSMGVNPLIPNPYYTPEKAQFSDGVLTKDKRNAEYLSKHSEGLFCKVTGAPEWDYRSRPEMLEEADKLRKMYGEKFVIICFHNATPEEIEGVAKALPIIDQMGYRFLIQPHPECIDTLPPALFPHTNIGQFHRYSVFTACSHAIVYANSTTFAENIMANSKIAIWPIMAHRGKWGNHQWVHDRDLFQKECLAICGSGLLGAVDILHDTPELTAFLSDSTPKYGDTLLQDEYGVPVVENYSEHFFKLVDELVDEKKGGTPVVTTQESTAHTVDERSESPSQTSKDLAIAIRIGSPKSKTEIVRNTLESIKKNIGNCDWKIFISLGDRLNPEVRKYVEEFVEANPKHCCIFQDGAYAWADFINSAIDESSDYEYFIKSHDDIIVHTEEFFPKAKKELQRIGRDVGWISFTDVEYKRGAYAISTRPGYHIDFLAGAAEKRKLYQFHSLIDEWWNPPPGHGRDWIIPFVDIPKFTVRCHAPLSHFVMIHRDSLKKIGKCEIWKGFEDLQFVMLNDEDWGLSALKHNLPNIWIPFIEYQHYHENLVDGYLVETRCGPELVKIADAIHKLFREKWGFASKYTEGDTASIDCIRNKYKDTLIPWSLDTNSYDWHSVT